MLCSDASPVHPVLKNLLLGADVIAPTQYSQSVLMAKDVILMLLYGFEMFLGVCGMSSNSSNLQMAGVRRIYRLPSLVAVAPMVS